MFSTTRKAATAVLLMASLIAALATPSFADKKDDLEKQKKGVSGKIGDAKKDLELSTKKYANAVAALKLAQGKLDAAQSTLSNTRGALATAKARDAEMQAKLTSTEAELDAAVARLSKGKAELRSSESKVEQFAVQNIEQGDPGMRAFSSLLQGEDPNAFSEQMSLNDAVSDDQLATMQSLAATRVILEVNRDRVTKLRDQVKAQREAAAANLVRKQNLEAAAEAQRAEVVELVTRPPRSARTPPAKLRAEDKKQLASLESERNSLEATHPGSDAQAGQGRRRRRRRHAVVPGQRIPDHLAVRDALPPGAARLEAARRHRLRRPLRDDRARGCRWHGPADVLQRRLRQPDHPQQRPDARQGRSSRRTTT